MSGRRLMLGVIEDEDTGRFHVLLKRPEGTFRQEPGFATRDEAEHEANVIGTELLHEEHRRHNYAARLRTFPPGEHPEGIWDD